MADYTDPFNRGDNANPSTGASYPITSLNGTLIELKSNALHDTDTGAALDSFCRMEVDFQSPDHEVSVRLATVTISGATGVGAGPMISLDTQLATTGFFLIADFVAQTVSMHDVISGVVTNGYGISAGLGAFAVGDVITLGRMGALLYAKKNGTTVLTARSSLYYAGRRGGVYFSRNSTLVDAAVNNWHAIDLITPPVPLRPPGLLTPFGLPFTPARPDVAASVGAAPPPGASIPAIPAYAAHVAYFATSFTTTSATFPQTPAVNAFVDYFHLSFLTATGASTPFGEQSRPAATPGVLGVWTWYVRDSLLNHVAQLDDYLGAEFVARFNDVGTWSVQLPVDAVAAAALTTPGAGVEVIQDGEVMFSGPANKIAKSTRGDVKTFEVSGISDEAWLQRRVAVPNPDDGEVVGGAIPFPPTLDTVKAGVVGIPDTVNLFNDLDNEAFSDSIGVVSVAGQTMLYRGTGVITVGYLAPYRITGVRVTATGRCDSGVNNDLFAYIRVSGVDYLGLHWINLSGSPSDAIGTWLTNPATGLAWTRADIETLINTGGYGFKALNASANNGDTGVGKLRLEVLSFAQDEYDNRANVTSTAMIRYADFNAGPSALASRRVFGLTMAVDPVIGGTTSNQARYGNLMELLQTMATPSGLGFRVDRVGAGLVFEVYQPLDRTAAVRFTPQLETMDDAHYEISAPSANAIYLGVNGEGVERTVAEPQDAAAILEWGRIEAFVDRRDVKVYADIPDAATRAVADAAAATALEFTPVDQLQMRYRQDWQLGDQVTADVEVEPPANTISRTPLTPTTRLSVTVVEVAFKFDSAGPVTMTAKVGTPSPQSILAAFDRSRAQSRSVASRLRALETNL